MANYTGDVKTKMDTGGDCATQSDTMFSTNQSVASEELARLKAGNALYAALLDTPHGRQFETNVGDATSLKFRATLMGAWVAEADSGGASGSDGVSGSDGPSTAPAGLDCLPSNGAEPSTLQGKLDVLNCLVFDTPYSFWANKAQTDQLLSLIHI